MQKLVVNQSGQVRFMSHDTRQPAGAFAGSAKRVAVKRASWIVPVRWPLRVAFYALRLVFGDCGLAAEFTRGWECDWLVDLRVSGGPVVGGFANRAAAVAYEEKWIFEHGK